MRLFLICLLCFLFATQSHASGENNDYNAAVVYHWTDSYRTSLARMLISGGINMEDVRFDPPGSQEIDQNIESQMFNKLGGGASYLDLSHPHPNGLNLFNDGSRIIFSRSNNVLIDDGENTELSDLVLFVQNATETECNKINASEKIEGIPAVSNTPNMENAGHEKNSTVVTLDTQGHSVGCFKLPDGKIVFLRILATR